jgi:anti-sigma B factor antagonist
MQVLSSESDGVQIVHIGSKVIDAGTARLFKSAIKPLLAEGGQLVFDLSTVEFIDSTGLGALVSCLRQAHALSAEIKLSGLTKPARALFELVRMHRVFEIFNSPEEAVASYRAKAGDGA